MKHVNHVNHGHVLRFATKIVVFVCFYFFFTENQIEKHHQTEKIKNNSSIYFAAVLNSLDRIKFDLSTAVARRLKPSCATAV